MAAVSKPGDRRRRSGRGFVVGALAIAVGLAGGCARRVEVFDLVSGLPLADVRADTGTVGLGEHQNRWHLESGWLYQGFDRVSDSTFAVATSEATLRFRATRSGDLTLQLAGRPIEGRQVAGRKLRLSINGQEQGRKVVHRRDDSYFFPIDESVLVSGTNRATLTLLPSSEENDEPAMAWSHLAILREETVEPALPRGTADGEGLILPAGVLVDYYLEIPPGAVLEVGDVAFGAAGPGALAVEVAQDGEAPVELLRLVEPERRGRVELDAFAGRPVRLSLEAIASDGVGSVAPDVILASARIDAPDTGAAEVASSEDRRLSSPGATAPNVLLFVVDALRADHLGTYGYPRDVSPNLDRLAQRATVFDSAIAQSSWTRASMASVHTGLWPMAHDTNGRGDVLADEAVTVAEVLQERGFETIGVAQNPNVFSVFGFAQGFDQFTELYHTDFEDELDRSDSEDALAEVRCWLEARETARPFFLWVHTIDPHTPYAAPPEFRTRYDDAADRDLEMRKPPGRAMTRSLPDEELERVKRHLFARYDSEIYYADTVLGELLDLMDQRALLDDTLLIFVSDHGEEFLDHGKWEHGRDLYASSLNIPLVIRAPGQQQGRRVAEVVQHIDLLPTILDYVGAPPVAGGGGRSLRELVEVGAGPDEPPMVFSYLHLDGKPYASVIDGDWKLIHRYPGDGLVVAQLFNRSEDPAETENRVLQEPIRARYMELQIEAKLAIGRRLSAAEAVMDERTEKSLRALGYLQ